jgi:hypothetical protein
MISLQLQEAMAQRIGATVVKVDASHAAMLSKPADAAAAIIEAARSVKQLARQAARQPQYEKTAGRS